MVPVIGELREAAESGVQAMAGDQAITGKAKQEALDEFGCITTTPWRRAPILERVLMDAPLRQKCMAGITAMQLSRVFESFHAQTKCRMLNNLPSETQGELFQAMRAEDSALMLGSVGCATSAFEAVSQDLQQATTECHDAILRLSEDDRAAYIKSCPAKYNRAWLDN